MKRNKNINNNQKKEKSSYAKMFKEQIKKEAEMNSNKSHILNNNKNTKNTENKNNKEEKQEIKHNTGINFDKLSDWDNIVYPNDSEINQIKLNELNNNNNINNNKNEIENNIIHQMNEENDNDSEKEQLEQIQNNINMNHNQNINNNLYNNLNSGLKPYNQNNLNEFSVNTSEFTNKNEFLNQYDNISLGTYNLDNNNLITGKKNQNLFNDNIVSQIKPLDFGGGFNDINNNVIKEEDSLENEDKNINEKNDNIKIDNIKNNLEFDDIKAQRDIMEQMEEEINLSMNQMNDLAGNAHGNFRVKDNNINKSKVKKNENIQKNKNINIINAKKDNIKKNENKNNVNKGNNKINTNNKTQKNVINNNNQILNSIKIQNNNIINKENPIPLNNLNEQNNKLNMNNFSFKPTNIQQISAEEVNAFIQKSQQKNNQNQQESNPSSISQIQPSLNQPQINTNINPNINININPNIPIQANMPPMYPSPYPIILPPNQNQIQNPQMMYGVPYPMYPPQTYPIPMQNQINMQNNIQNIETKNDKKKVNYKPKSLKEYKEKYNSGIKEHRGGLGANIGGEEWEHKKEQNLKVKKYSEMIKNHNKDKENNFKNKFKIKNELNEQLYDSLSDEVIEDEPKEKEKNTNAQNENNNIKENNKEKKESLKIITTNLITERPKTETTGLVTESIKTETTNLVTDKPKTETTNLVTESPKEETTNSVTDSPKTETTNIVTERPKAETTTTINSLTETPKIETTILVTEKPKVETTNTVTESPKIDTTITILKSSIITTNTLTDNPKMESTNIQTESQKEETTIIATESSSKGTINLVTDTQKETITETTTDNKSSNTTQISITTTDQNIDTTNQVSPTTKRKEKVVFVLQMQKIEKLLKMFIIVNYKVLIGQIFRFPVRLYSRNSRRNLADTEDKEIQFTPSENFEGNSDGIIELKSLEEIDENVEAVLLESSDNKELEIKITEDKNNIDTVKVKEVINNGGLNFANVVNNQNTNYNLYKYSISSSTQGCNFYLTSEEAIEESNKKEIILKFINVEDNKNVEAKCTLSKGEKNIPCVINEKIDNNYILDPYIYSDDKETITITQSNNIENIPLECSISLKTQNRKDDSDGLSAGAIIAIVLSIVGALALAAIVFLCVSKTPRNTPAPSETLHTIDNSENIKDIKEF